MYKLIQIGIFLLLPIFLVGQISNCSTVPKDYAKAKQYMKKLKLSAQQMQQRNAAPSFVIRIQFWRISNDAGTFGPSDQEINDQLDIVRDDFAAADICFALVGIRYINDDDLLLSPSDANSQTVATDLYDDFGSEDRLDVFVFPDEYGDIPGNAFAIPNDYLVCSEGRWFGSKNLSHEIGHCVGLLHTHQGDGSACPSSNRERIDGSNCNSSGDLLCDTNADPRLDRPGAFSSATCTFLGTTWQDCNGDSPYEPPFNNYMSYGWSCRNQFSPQQISIMRAECSGGDKGENYSQQVDHRSVGPEDYSWGIRYSVANLSVTSQGDFKTYGSAQTRHFVSDQGHVELKPGFHAYPTGNKGKYIAKASDFCGN